MCRSDGEIKNVFSFLVDDIGNVYLEKEDICIISTLSVILMEF